MKKFIFLLLFIFPVVAFAQYNLLKDSPMDYAWQNVGNAGFSAGEANWTSLAFNQSGQAYVAYSDNSYSGKATVMKFNGTNWVNVGTAGFSAAEAGYTSLAISLSGDPYVAYEDYGSSHKATVMKYDFPEGINNKQQSQILLYPNPASDQITIE